MALPPGMSLADVLANAHAHIHSLLGQAQTPQAQADMASILQNLSKWHQTHAPGVPLAPQQQARVAAPTPAMQQQYFANGYNPFARPTSVATGQSYSMDPAGWMNMVPTYTPGTGLSWGPPAPGAGTVTPDVAYAPPF